MKTYAVSKHLNYINLFSYEYPKHKNYAFIKKSEQKKIAWASSNKSFADLFFKVYMWIHILPQVFTVILKNLSA